MSDLNLSLHITAPPFCGSGTPLKKKTNSVAATVPSFVGTSVSVCNQTWTDKEARAFCVLELRVHRTWLRRIRASMREPVCWRRWVSVGECVYFLYSMFISIPSRGGLTGFWLEWIRKKRNSRLSHIASVFNIYAYIVECVCVCVKSSPCSVCYVACNCLRLTIHHRAVFLTLSLLSSVTNLFSPQPGEEKTFFKIALTSVFIPFSCKLNECIHNKLSRKRF